MVIRITSWNVNGIRLDYSSHPILAETLTLDVPRNPFSYQPWRESRTFDAMFDLLEADIVVMQETKIQRKDLQDDMVLVPGWDVYFSLPRHKKGYSGVAIYTRNSVCAPIRAEEGVTGILCPPNSSTKFSELPADQQIGGYPHPGQLSGIVDEATLDSEGRCVILEFPAFVLIGTYCPATRDETRDDFRQGFLEALDARIRNLVAMGKRVILTGDINIIRSGIDTAGISERLRKEGMTLEDFFSSSARRLFNHLIFEGTVYGERDDTRQEPVLWDLGRLFNPGREGMFTCWETKKNARPGNFGSRIDYVLCSANMKDWVVESNIQEGLMGSDHCPVFATISDEVVMDGKTVHIRDWMNPAGMFHNGKRLRDWAPKDLLSLSARLIPEFDRRQTIKSMFFKQPSISIDTLASQDSENEATPDQVRPPQVTPRPSQTSTQPESPRAPSSTMSPPARTTPIGLKRTTSSSSAANKSTKKAKSSLAKEPVVDKGQSSLMGFFKPKIPPKQDASPSAQGETAPPSTRDDGVLSSETPNGDINNEPKSQAGNALAPPVSPEKVFDPISSKESWSKLLGSRVLPRCEHGEDCISFVTKKPGVNCGRSFFMCSRPLGPSGQKERNTQWRCGTFIWSSDWNGPKAT